jgi:deazaflavin-dependent oxidoreductase (nitroreductase family)
MPLPQGLAKFNRVVTNQITGVVAGRLPGFGIVVHTGRKSGRVYRTPVNVFPHDGRYRIALTYGPDSDWVRNVLAAGRFELETAGHTLTLTDPIVQHDPGARWAPIGVRQVLGVVSAPDYLEARPA